MNNRILLMMLLLGILSACNNDDEGGIESLTPQEGQQRMAEISDEMHDDVIEMVSSEGIETLLNLVELGSFTELNARTNQIAAIKQAQRTIENVSTAFNPWKQFTDENTDEEEFDFEGSLGVYSWSFDLQKFIQEDQVVDHIEIHFPSKGSETNDAVFYLYEFETSDAFEERMPSKIRAELLLEERLIASLSLDIVYSALVGIQSATVDLFLDPFNYNLSFQIADSSVAIAASVSRDDTAIMGAALAVVFDNLITQDVVSLEAEVFYRALKVEGSLDVPGLEASESLDEMNENIDFALYYNEDKIGDIVLAYNEEIDDVDLYLQYADGSMELLEDFFAPVIDELEAVILELEGA